MSQKTVSKDFHSNIQDWIYARLSKPNGVFNNMPACPYAKKAWLDGSVKTHYLDDTHPIEYILNAEIENYTYHWPKKTEVVVLGFDYKRLLPYKLSAIIDDNKHMLDKRGFTALEDHPFERESVEDVWLNNGQYGLVLLQPTAKLKEARQYLEEKGYYKNWPDKYKQEVQAR